MAIRIPFVLQLGPYDCAPANLIALGRAYGIHLTNREVREMCGTSSAGTSVWGLQRAAERLGFDTGLDLLDIYDIRDDQQEVLPAVAALKRNGAMHHFVTIQGIDGDRVTVMDPSRGIVKMRMSVLHDSMVRHRVVVDQESLEKQNDCPELRAELARRLGRYGIAQDTAHSWLQRAGVVPVDDSLKYVERLMECDSFATLGAPGEVLCALLETGAYLLPEKYRSLVSDDAERSSRRLLYKPLVLTVRCPRSPSRIGAAASQGPRRQLLNRSLAVGPDTFPQLRCG